MKYQLIYNLLSKGHTNASVTTPNGSCSLELSKKEERCFSPNEEENVQKLYDFRYNCSELEPDCQCKREKARKQAEKYYKICAEAERQQHKYINGTHKIFARGKVL